MGSSTYLPDSITNPIDEIIASLTEARKAALAGVGASTNREFVRFRLDESLKTLNKLLVDTAPTATKSEPVAETASAG